MSSCGASQVMLVAKNVSANAGDARNTGLILEWERFPGIGNGNPVQCSGPKNSTDRRLAGYSP